jgi:hypothetical protein
MNYLSTVMGAAAACGLAASASASILYNNDWDGVLLNGDCSWSTTCAAGAGRGDDFAAQEFTLGSAADIASGGFYELPNYSTGVTSVNWMILDANGTGGLPGTVVASGSGAVTGYVTSGTGAPEGLFTIGSVSLAAGTYYLAIQGVSVNVGEYLGGGVAGSGAANTNDGGTTWTSGYVCELGGACDSSIGVELFGSVGVPEPATWAMMLAGFAGLGAALRLRRGKLAAA